MKVLISQSAIIFKIHSDLVLNYRFNILLIYYNDEGKGI